MISTPGIIVQAINFAILFAVIVVACLIGRDARKRGLPWISAIVWVLAAFFIPFFIGAVLYFLIGRPKTASANHS
ncbi:MAG: PLDc N-terminal domain-containing protein [Chloroflexota bacterium]|nr:PLDc N-terminal domain-containing protein [Chloroflexota bacterium]